jgi:hypothetical protein
VDSVALGKFPLRFASSFLQAEIRSVDVCSLGSFCLEGSFDSGNSGHEPDPASLMGDFPLLDGQKLPVREASQRATSLPVQRAAGDEDEDRWCGVRNCGSGVGMGWLVTYLMGAVVAT